MESDALKILVRNTRAQDFKSIMELTREVYPGIEPWKPEQLASHLAMFPEGQLVAAIEGSEQIVGMAASLIILWDDYHIHGSWNEFTDHGMFTNHDPARGHTLYAAEVIVSPVLQGRGIGKMLYAARQQLVERMGLLRIRAGGRLRGYHRYAAQMSADEYVIQVIRGTLRDRTLSFQLARGFEVLAVIPGYLRNDPESLGYAAVIEWTNKVVATPADFAGRDPRYRT